jgi:hypothetical protein
MTRRAVEEFDEPFTAFVRSRGEHHLRIATLLTGNPDAAEALPGLVSDRHVGRA